jgi:hypothetical protein
MELEFIAPNATLRPIEPATLGEPGDNDPQPRVDTANVHVSYGVHHGRYPIGGMTIGQARQTLTPLINIDPTAIAVIGGQPVPDEHRIGSDISMLTFVKPSSMKG